VSAEDKQAPKVMKKIEPLPRDLEIQLALSALPPHLRDNATGSFMARLLPGARIVRAFTTVYFEDLKKTINKGGEKIGIPIASDDQEGLEAAVELADHAGFDPIVVGSLSKSKMFDVGTAVYATSVSAREIKQKLKLK
jgi:predicted dinucleotide-binding enzyme